MSSSQGGGVTPQPADHAQDWSHSLNHSPGTKHFPVKVIRPISSSSCEPPNPPQARPECGSPPSPEVTHLSTLCVYSSVSKYYAPQDKPALPAEAALPGLGRTCRRSLGHLAVWGGEVGWALMGRRTQQKGGQVAAVAGPMNNGRTGLQFVDLCKHPRFHGGSK